MEIFFGVCVVILFLLLVAWPWIRRVVQPMFQRWAMGKMEDQMRRMVGMPTRKEERKARKRAQKVREKGAGRFRAAAEAAGWRRPGSGFGRDSSESAAGLMREVAEDVEFTEVREYSREETHPTVDYRVEEQVEDAEFTEIKIKGK